MFERRLRELNPAMRTLTYEARDVAVYLDSLVRARAVAWCCAWCLMIGCRPLLLVLLTPRRLSNTNHFFGLRKQEEVAALV